jgi:hypothetical protein
MRAAPMSFSQIFLPVADSCALCRPRVTHAGQPRPVVKRRRQAIGLSGPNA